MSNNGTIITRPVSQRDVQDVLGISRSINRWSQLCTHVKINKWAKYKPVSYNSKTELSEAQRQSVNYGISHIPSWSYNGAFSKMIEFWLMENKTAANAPDCGFVDEYWKYTKPQGGSASPYRITDFTPNTSVGYFHGADAPLGGLKSLSAMITANGQLVMTWHKGAQDPQTLKYSDLKFDTGSQFSLSGFYFTAILARVGATGTKYAMTDVNQSAEEALAQGVYCRPYFEDLSHVNAFMGNSNQADFYCMICLSNAEIYDTFTVTEPGGSTTYRKFLTSFDSISADKFVALLDSRQIITITKMVAKCIIVEMTAWKVSGDTRKVYFSLTVRNGDAVTARNYDITVTVWDHSGNDIGHTTKTIGLSAGGEDTISSNVDCAQSFSGATRVHVFTQCSASSVLIKATDETTVNISGPAPTPTPTDPTPYDDV